MEIQKVTGDEPAMPMQSEYIDEDRKGLTIKQLALKDFMCALIKDTTLPHGSYDEANWLVKTASLLTDAYINELNKNV